MMPKYINNKTNNNKNAGTLPELFTFAQIYRPNQFLTSYAYFKTKVNKYAYV